MGGLTAVPKRPTEPPRRWYVLRGRDSPVPNARGLDTPTEEQKRRYLVALRKLGRVSGACASLPEPITIGAVKHWRTNDATFARDEQLVRDDLEVAALIGGVQVPWGFSTVAAVDLIEEYQRGATIYDLGERYGMKANTVYQRMRRGGAKFRRRGRPTKKGPDTPKR